MLYVIRYEHLKKCYTLLCQYDNEDSGVRGLQNQLLLLLHNKRTNLNLIPILC